MHCTWLGPPLEVSGTVELWDKTYSNWDPLRLATLTQTLMAKGPFVPYGTASSSTMLSFACMPHYTVGLQPDPALCDLSALKQPHQKLHQSHCRISQPVEGTSEHVSAP